jgi:lysyl-tRNA synthetase class 2
MSKRRDEYLQNHWIKYPEMPRGALRYGRVQQTRLGTQILIDWTFKDAGEIRAGDVLVDGDLVAMFPNNQIMLLAPNLTDRIPKNDKWPEQKRWFDYLTFIRTFFKEKRFQDVKTPVLVTCPGTEPTLDVFETEFELGARKLKYFLPTSPEIGLKKLLCEGAERIFEIAPVFRNNELTERHPRDKNGYD